MRPNDAACGRRAPRRSWLAALMAGSIALVVALGVWDQNRGAEAALRDAEREQAAFAALLAASVTTQLEIVRSDALAAGASANGEGSRRSPQRHYAALQAVPVSAPRPTPPAGHVVVSVPSAEGERIDVVVRVAQLLAGAGGGEQPALALLRPPGASAFYSATGARLVSAPLREALDRGRPSVRLTRAEAVALGLTERIATAGTAWAGAGDLGRWAVAVVSSAARERDRQTRARWRLASLVVIAGGLVLAFGGYAARSQRKELELARELTLAELEQRRDEQLERDGRAATMLTLAAGVAHEVSTPLSVIHGRAEQLLERLGGDERGKRAAQRILEQSVRIEGVIRGFLTLARGDTPALEVLDPADVVREAAALVEHRFAKAVVGLVVAPAPALPQVRGDRRLLEHALINLLLNACDACERGGHVWFAARAAPEGGAVLFEVSDDGSGISPELVARVMEPFFSTKPAGHGTGLGLAIASEIVKIHRGALTLEPRAPNGTTAVVRVPVADGAPDASA